jgi:hypothetical protein
MVPKDSIALTYTAPGTPLLWEVDLSQLRGKGASSTTPTYANYWVSQRNAPPALHRA